MEEQEQEIMKSIRFNLERFDKALDDTDNRFLNFAQIYDCLKYDIEMLDAVRKATKKP